MIELGYNELRMPRAPPSILGGKWMRRGLNYRDADAFGRKLEQCETELSTAKRQAFEARMQCDATVNTARQKSRVVCFTRGASRAARRRQVGSGEAEARLRAASY